MRVQEDPQHQREPEARLRSYRPVRVFDEKGCPSALRSGRNRGQPHRVA
ncbi:hypothetical protein VSH64_08675 [Amycolatopsis rhabdoformis]|uniref:Uncharacterized protein n=1 Tax=Amycolatopsis rhabdoformis TaxID=1448059 RepID=A0ABZ1IDM5_9PSEU|nr:hypothetical protein [Amycolatopsis rhabdoformis]WSE32181.1 hypothetical protein VSH64_08675 [Amycolatopsis rhabdoformis]